MRKMNNYVCIHEENERGFAIVIVLVILLTLTVLAVGVITSSTVNSAMSRNYEKNTQAVNMSEIGVKVAYREFINSGFLQTTHTLNGDSLQIGSVLLETTLSDYYIDTDGDFVWEWDENKAYDPMWDTDEPHGFKFRVHYTSGISYLVESTGWFGTIRKRTRARGFIENMFEFAYFASRDLGDLSKDNDLTISDGKIHANGDLYIRPANGSTLELRAPSLTAAGFIYRSRDAWGQPDDGGICEISKDEPTGSLVEMDSGTPIGSEGIAFDSLNLDWNDRSTGARELWGGVVRDKVPYKSPPPAQNLETGGFYDQTADLHITNTIHNDKAWCTQVTFWNWNEQLFVTAEDIDVGALIASSEWPANGLIYCNTPTRLSNASLLSGNLMFVSNSSIYTKGDFNTVSKKGAALMTRHRIYHLSALFDDSQSSNSKNRAAVTTTINAALVDGAPTVDEYNWVDNNGDNVYDYSGVTIYNPVSPKTAAGFSAPNSSTDPRADCKNLLERWTGETITVNGSIIHLGGAEMCPNLDNSGITSDQLAWIQKTGYREPDSFIYTYDTSLSDVNIPPFTPLIGYISSWAPF